MTPAPWPSAQRRLVQNTPLLTSTLPRHSRPRPFLATVIMPEPASVMAGRARQRLQEDEEDKITRKAGAFAEFEADMPKLANRFSFSLKDNLSSYLGARNPFYENVNPETDYVWLLDTTAYQNRIGRWKAEVVAAYFSKNSGKDASEVVAWVSEKIGLAEDDEARNLVADRIQPLLDSILPAHAVEIDLQGMNVRLGPSGRDGISSDELAIPGNGYKDGQISTARAINADATPMNITFAKPTGWAVLSDVDDTIKKTLTSSPIGILKTTFAEEPEPIKGMPELYKHIVQKLDNPPFWYLSASPYNLYPFLRQFRETYYPSGTMILRDASWMNLAGFLANLTQGTQAYKVDRIEKVNSWFPKRKFVLIGDSTQSDPEAYGEAYRKHTKWVGAIYIRKVMGVEGMDEAKKNAPERFEKAFKDVPKDLWYVFEDAQELYAKIDALVVEKK
jgi:phosphatidate phosphatase APP1